MLLSLSLSLSFCNSSKSSSSAACRVTIISRILRFANALAPPQFFPSPKRNSQHDRIVVIIFLRKWLSRHRGKTLKARVILPLLAPQRNPEEDERRRQPSWLSVQVFRTWAGYEAGFSRRVFRRLRVANSSATALPPSPLARSGSSTKRVSRFCLKREFHSRIRPICRTRESWSLLGKLPSEKLPRQSLPAVKMIPQCARATTGA